MNRRSRRKFKPVEVQSLLQPVPPLTPADSSGPAVKEDADDKARKEARELAREEREIAREAREKAKDERDKHAHQRGGMSLGISYAAALLSLSALFWNIHTTNSNAAKMAGSASLAERSAKAAEESSVASKESAKTAKDNLDIATKGVEAAKKSAEAAIINAEATAATSAFLTKERLVVRINRELDKNRTVQIQIRNLGIDTTIIGFSALCITSVPERPRKKGENPPFNEYTPPPLVRNVTISKDVPMPIRRAEIVNLDLNLPDIEYNKDTEVYIRCTTVYTDYDVPTKPK